MNPTFSFLGAGNMAEAIIVGIKSSMPEAEITVFVRNETKQKRFEAHGCRCTYNLADALSAARYIFLSVKPQNFAELLDDMAACAPSDDHVYVTIAAGITTSRVADSLGAHIACIRTMPNTPLLLGEGVTAICRNEQVGDADFSFITSLFGKLGETLILPEEKMDAVISVSGSSPAYIYLVIKSMVNAAIASGFEREDAMRAVCATIKGACDMAITTGKTPEELISAVTSKGGTTERAMNVLYDADLEGILTRAMKACDDRAAEMTRLFSEE
ncbi:MAG: pyrroline-5-carboxylate reductase [Clostridia bacterium]|nr:pyrroline-5-carboxylate reductase [Clostridia bacterium]